MKNWTKTIAIRTTANADSIPITGTGDSFKSKRIVSICTRVGGKTINKLSIVSKAVLDVLFLELKEEGTDTRIQMPLSYILAMSSEQNGCKGLPVGFVASWDDSKMTCYDPSVLVTDQAVELCVTFEK